MATVSLHGDECHTNGDLPEVGSMAPDFHLVSKDLKDMKLADYAGKKIIMNIVPSLDTGICALSTKKFNETASSLDNTVILVISADLPFAQSRFCEAEGTKNI